MITLKEISDIKIKLSKKGYVFFNTGEDSSDIDSINSYYSTLKKDITNLTKKELLIAIANIAIDDSFVEF